MNLFNFDRIVTENFDLKDYIQRTQADEVFLHTTLNTLSKLNESVNGSIKKLYTSVLEADSKAEENKYFCETFKEFKEVVCNFISDMNVMLGRFSIELDNIVDANKDLLEDDNYITNYNGGCVINATKYKNLNSDFPKVDPILVYKKEFDKIGTLMQDIGNLASNEVKLKVIASVYNDFAKDLNTGWNEKIISSIVGDGATSDNYAEALYNLYREGSKEVEITKSLLFSAKNCLLGYKQYVSLTTASIQSILDEFEKIALDVESMVFRNEDNKLRIDTPTDGVENRDYQLDVYSTNQLNIFMKAKIAQITQLCNLYSIAISMKLDAIKEYVNQNKNILQCVKYNCSECDNEEPNQDEDIENTPSDDELTDDTSIEDHTEEKDSEEELDDSHDDFYDNNDNQEDLEQEDDEEDDDEDMSDESSDDFYDNEPSSAVQADDDEITNEAGIGVTLKNAKSIYNNLLTNALKNGNFEKIRPNLLKIVSKCKTLEDIKYLKKDLSTVKSMLTKLADDTEYAIKHKDDTKSKYVNLRKRAEKGCTPDKIRAHIKWLSTEYTDAINKKAEEIKQKSIKEETIDVRDSMDEIEYESYILDYHLFSLDRILEQEEIMDTLRESMILKEEGTSGDSNQSQNNTNPHPSENLNKDLVSQKGIDVINFLLSKIEELWKAFEHKFISGAGAKSKIIKSKEKYIVGNNLKYKDFGSIIEAQGNGNKFKMVEFSNPDGVDNKFKTIPNFDVTIDNISNQEITDKYKDEASYFMKEYDIKDDSGLKLSDGGYKSINIFIQEMIIKGQDAEWKDVKGMPKQGDAFRSMYDFCYAGYSAKIEDLLKYHKAIMALKSKLAPICKNFDNQINSNNSPNNNQPQQQDNNSSNQDSNNNDQTKQESYSLKSTKEEYFNEFSGGDIPESVKKQNAAGGQSAQFKKMLKIYISVHSKILSGQMSGLHKVYNEYYNILKYVAKYNGDTSQDDTNKQNDQQQDNNK